MGGLLAAGLLDALFGNPAEAARRAQEAETRRKEEEERERQAYAEAIRRQEEAKQRILGLLKGAESSGELGLKLDSDSQLAVRAVPGAFGGTDVVPESFGEATVGDDLGLKLGDDAIPVESAAPAMLSETSAPDFPASWGTPEQVHDLLAPDLPAVSPGASDYIGRAARFVAQETWDASAATAQAGADAAFGPLGGVLINEAELSGFVLPQVAAAAAGNLTVEQANVLPFAAANFVFNTGSLPNQLADKMLEQADSRAGLIAFTTDQATALATDGIVDAIGKNVTFAVAKFYSDAKYAGGQTARSPGGHFQHIEYIESLVENTRALREDADALIGATRLGQRARAALWSGDPQPPAP